MCHESYTEAIEAIRAAVDFGGGVIIATTNDLRNVVKDECGEDFNPIVLEHVTVGLRPCNKLGVHPYFEDPDPNLNGEALVVMVYDASRFTLEDAFDHEPTAIGAAADLLETLEEEVLQPV